MSPGAVRFPHVVPSNSALRVAVRNIGVSAWKGRIALSGSKLFRSGDYGTWNQRPVIAQESFVYVTHNLDVSPLAHEVDNVIIQADSDFQLERIGLETFDPDYQPDVLLMLTDMGSMHNLMADWVPWKAWANSFPRDGVKFGSPPHTLAEWILRAAMANRREWHSSWLPWRRAYFRGRKEALDMAARWALSLEQGDEPVKDGVDWICEL